MNVSVRDQKECLQYFIETIRQTNMECEARLMPVHTKSSNDFYRFWEMIRKFIFTKKMGGYEYRNEQETKLDISWKEVSEHNIDETTYERLTLYGSDNIKLYWLREDWKEVSWKWMKKTKQKKYTFEDYPVRIGLSKEEEIGTFDPTKETVMPKEWEKIWKELGQTDVVKNYRYKKTYRIYPPAPMDDFYFELSEVKMGNGSSFKTSNTLQGNTSYEFEIEWNRAKEIQPDMKKEIQQRYKSFIHMIQMILYFYTESPTLLPNSERDRVVSEYDTFVKQFGEGHRDANAVNKSNNYYFFVANPVSLHMKHLMRETKGVHLHQPYAMTLKADGERHLFYVNGTGQMYLLNHSLEWKKTDYVMKGMEHSLLEGEYIVSSQLGLVYDVLFWKNEDVRSKPFLTFSKDATKEGRFIFLDQFDRAVKELQKEDGTHTMQLQAKPYVFSFGRTETEIFEKSKEIWDSRLKAPYDVDGIIFVPMEEAYPKKSGAWKNLLKWKPEEYNTIDFLIKVVKDEQGYEKRFVTEVEGKEVYYKVVELFITGVQEEYDPIRKQVVRRYLPVPFLPDESTIGTTVEDTDTTLFLHDGYRGVQYARILLDAKGRMLTKDIYQKHEIESDVLDDMIVEFSYDRKHIYQPDGFSWIPVRIRHDKTEQYRSGNMIFGNYERTAYDLWKVIQYPVYDEMIFYGSFPSDLKELIEEEEQELGASYYDACDIDSFDFKKRSKMQNFHNMIVKKRLIHSVAPALLQNSKESMGSFIDLACGKGGDLSKWSSARFKNVVSMDVDRACVQYAIQYYKRYKNPYKPNVYFLQADTSKPIFPAYEAGANDYMRKKMEEILPTRYMFDVASSQFCLHYFFREEYSLRMFLMNVSDNLKMGGSWIGTCFDGRNLFTLLKDKKELSSIPPGESQALWSIQKNYKEKTWNVKKPFGKSIQVYVQSIGKTHEEYLVDLDILEAYAAEYGLKMVERKPFSVYFDEMMADDQEETKVHMNESEKEFSFLNVSFTFTKIDVIDQRVYQRHKK
jgi:mRNA capping enzyme/mRNA capping enzyme, catalytic domain